MHYPDERLLRLLAKLVSGHNMKDTDASDQKQNAGSPKEHFSPRLILRVRRYLFQLLILGLAVHLLLPQLSTLQHMGQVIKGMALWAVGLAAVAQVASYAGSGYLLKSIVSLVGQRLSIVRGMVITLAAFSIGLLAGGVVGTTAATYRWIEGSGVSSEGAALSAWLQNLFFNNAAMACVSLFGLLHLLLAHELSTGEAMGFGFILILLGLVGGVFLWGLKRPEKLSALWARLSSRWASLRRRQYDPEKSQAELSRLFGAWNALRSGRWFGPVAGAFMNLGFDMLTLYLLFVAAGHSVTPGVLLVGYGLPQLLAKFAIILPGGVGVVEAGMASLYHGLGVPDAVTVVVVLAYRMMSFWLPTLIGFPLIPYLQHVGSRREAGF